MLVGAGVGLSLWLPQAFGGGVPGACRNICVYIYRTEYGLLSCISLGVYVYIYIYIRRYTYVYIYTCI